MKTDRDPARRRVVLEPPGHVEAVHEGKHDVEKNEIGLLTQRERQCLLAFRRLEHVEALHLQVQAADGAHRRLVVDEENAFAAVRHAATILLCGRGKTREEAVAFGR